MLPRRTASCSLGGLHDLSDPLRDAVDEPRGRGLRARGGAALRRGRRGEAPGPKERCSSQSREQHSVVAVLPPPSLLLPLPMSLLYLALSAPPLPTVAPTRVPTVQSLPPAPRRRTVRADSAERREHPRQGTAGIGVTFSVDVGGRYFVRALAPGGPAARSGGVQPGDILEAVDGRAVHAGPPPLVLIGHAASLTPY